MSSLFLKDLGAGASGYRTCVLLMGLGRSGRGRVYDGLGEELGSGPDGSICAALRAHQQHELAHQPHRHRQPQVRDS